MPTDTEREAFEKAAASRGLPTRKLYGSLYEDHDTRYFRDGWLAALAHSNSGVDSDITKLDLDGVPFHVRARIHSCFAAMQSKLTERNSGVGELVDKLIKWQRIESALESDLVVTLSDEVVSEMGTKVAILQAEILQDVARLRQQREQQAQPPAGRGGTVCEGCGQAFPPTPKTRSTGDGLN